MTWAAWPDSQSPISLQKALAANPLTAWKAGHPLRPVRGIFGSIPRGNNGDEPIRKGDALRRGASAIALTTTADWLFFTSVAALPRTV
jgi:hypothetical protein